MAIIRKRALFGMLGLVAGVWVFSFAQTAAVGAQLEDIAVVKMEYLQDGEEFTLEMSPVVTASREYLLFGKTTGKITIYSRPVGDDHIGGTDFFMELRDGKWVETESSHCSAEECQTRGRSALEKRVVTIRP